MRWKWSKAQKVCWLAIVNETVNKCAVFWVTSMDKFKCVNILLGNQQPITSCQHIGSGELLTKLTSSTSLPLHLSGTVGPRRITNPRNRLYLIPILLPSGN